jgi:hypothetical protein
VDFLRRFNFENVDIGQISPEILEITQDLFIGFTKDTWLCLHESFLPAGIRPKPSNLKEAMEVWACQKILSLLGGKSTFFPSTYELNGAPKKKNSDVSFKELRTLFFPSPNQHFKPNAIWAVYTEPSGYIWRYWEILEEKKDAPDVIDAIQESLDEIFGQLQCLPQSTSDGIWHPKAGSVCFLTNPFYYRVKSINSMGRQTLMTGPQRPQVSIAELRKRLNPGITISRKRKINSTKTKTLAGSSKSRKYRHPPKKKQRMNSPLHSQLNPIHPGSPSPRAHVTCNSSEDDSSSNKPNADQMDTDSDSFF